MVRGDITRSNKSCFLPHAPFFTAQVTLLNNLNKNNSQHTTVRVVLKKTREEDKSSILISIVIKVITLTKYVKGIN